MANIKRANTSGITKSGVAIPDVPDAPTIGAATNVGTSRAYNNGSATVAFTAGATGGTPTSYTATSTPGSFTASGAGSPLTVTGLQSATSYTFAVTATNATATGPASSASSSITATTVPNAPTIGTATNASGQSYTGSASISVPFTAPATGGAAISSYTVTSSSGNTGTGSSSPISVSETVGNPTSTARTYTVTATNANGTSTASSASNSIAAVSVPQAPTIGAATAGNASATVAYTANATGGAAVTTYTATSSPGGFTGTGASPITVSGLTNGTAYTFTVTATNSAGTSAASSASSAVTPVEPIAFVIPNTNDSGSANFTSANGTTWTQRSAIDLNTNFYANYASVFSKWYAIPSSGSTYYYSTDGINWTSGTLATSNGWNKPISVGTDRIVLYSGQTNLVNYSTNGTTWTQAATPNSNATVSETRIASGNGFFLGWQASSGIIKSSNGSTWSNYDVQNLAVNGYTVAGLTFGNGRFLLYADRVYYSTDTTTWTAGGNAYGYLASSAFSIYHQSAGLFMIFSNLYNYFYTTPTGATTTQRAFTNTAELNRIVYTAGTVNTAVFNRNGGGGGQVAYSTNGTTITYGTSLSTNFVGQVGGKDSNY